MATAVKATCANGGSTALRDAAVELTTPEGWTARATTPTRFDRIAPGATAEVTWKVTVPTDGSPGPYDLSVRAVHRGAKTDDSARLRVSVPCATPSDARDNTGRPGGADWSPARGTSAPEMAGRSARPACTVAIALGRHRRAGRRPAGCRERCTPSGSISVTAK
ncbi:MULTISPECIES: NEW3 domain-containing protein [Streptomyces]|uniref:NEW3 domain-containing protein n=2 Tax=Streptomyces TaxID=1883 RepID=A0ABV9IGN8_9ACTN